MANHLDLEEQEQIDQLKHFWNTWGTVISSILVVVFGSVALWNGYNFWQSREALQASALLNAVQNSKQIDDKARLEQAFVDIRSKYASTTQAAQSGLVAAKFEIEKNNPDAVQADLEWIAAHASDEGYKAIAQLRLASLLIEKKSYELAMKHLAGKFPVQFDAVVADRKGDVFSLQNKKQEAIAEYLQAYAKIIDRENYRRLLEVKLNALGVAPDTLVDLKLVGVNN